MSTSRQAHPLDPDLLPWLRQPEENVKAYGMFKAFLDSTERKLTMFDDPKYIEKGWTQGWANKFSSAWHWGFRSHAYDVYLGQVETEEMVRYRREMTKRQRNVARVAQNKITGWLANLDPLTLKPIEAAKWYELAVEVERTASGFNQIVSQGGSSTDTEAEHQQTLSEVMGIDPSVEAELELSAELHRLLSKLDRPQET
jgi:hypothetical protein